MTLIRKYFSKIVFKLFQFFARRANFFAYLLIFSVPVVFFLINALVVTIIVQVKFSRNLPSEQASAIAMKYFLITFLSSLFLYIVLVFLFEFKSGLINHSLDLDRYESFEDFFATNHQKSFERIWMTRDQRLIMMYPFYPPDEIEDFIDRYQN